MPDRFDVCDFPTRSPDLHPETMDWIARIDAVRRNRPVERHCTGPCDLILPLESFPRNRAQPLGRDYTCSGCASKRKRDLYRRQKVMSYHKVLGVA